MLNHVEVGLSSLILNYYSAAVQPYFVYCDHFLAVSDVERRSRSLRTQYGRVLWHPERVSTAQQKMLREKLDFLRPYIVRRRGDSYLVSGNECKRRLQMLPCRS